MSTAQRGLKRSDEHRAKNAAAHRGKTHSNEARAKIAAALRGKKHGPPSVETRARLSATAKAVWARRLTLAPA